MAHSVHCPVAGQAALAGPIVGCAAVGRDAGRRESGPGCSDLPLQAPSIPSATRTQANERMELPPVLWGEVRRRIAPHVKPRMRCLARVGKTSQTGPQSRFAGHDERTKICSIQPRSFAAFRMTKPRAATRGFDTLVDDATAQRFRPFARCSRDAACLRGAAAFFAEPFRALAVARFGVFGAADLLLGAAWCFFAVLFSGFAATFGAAARALTRALGCGTAGAITFSEAFAGAALVGLRTSLPGAGAAAAGAATAAVLAADAAFVLPFGRPPFRAN